MANKHPVKRYPLDLDPNSKEAKWLERQTSRKRSLVFLIDQAIDQFGNVDLIDALLGQVTLVGGNPVVGPGEAKEAPAGKPAVNAPQETNQEPSSAPASPATKKATRPVGLDRLSKRN